MSRQRRERLGFVAWLLLVIGFAATTACIPSCNMAIQDREKPQPVIEPASAKPAVPPTPAQLPTAGDAK